MTATDHVARTSSRFRKRGEGWGPAPWRAVAAIALGMPAALVAAVVAVALAGPAQAGPATTATAEAAETCPGESLLPRLEASGRLSALRAEADAVRNGKGKLYRVEKDGLKPSFLYGTMHMTDRRVLALAPAANAGLEGADRLVIETTDVLDGPASSLALLARPDLLNLPAGRTLADYLDPDQRRLVEEKLGAYGLSFDAMKTLQPWFFSVALLVPPCEAARQAAGAEVLDVALAKRAKGAGQPVLGLETAVEQLEAMASLSMKLQIESLLATLELKPEMPDVFETMIQLYQAGDIAMISEIAEAAMPMGEDTAESMAGYAEFEDRIVSVRNHVMAERLAPILARGGTFVAVGALHLPGEEGLVELLKAAGYRLTRAD